MIILQFWSILFEFSTIFCYLPELETYKILLGILNLLRWRWFRLKLSMFYPHYLVITEMFACKYFVKNSQYLWNGVSRNHCSTRNKPLSFHWYTFPLIFKYSFTSERMDIHTLLYISFILETFIFKLSLLPYTFPFLKMTVWKMNKKYYNVWMSIRSQVNEYLKMNVCGRKF